MNLYDIVIKVLENADENDMSLKDDMSKQLIATDIYDLFYENQVYSSFVDSTYLEDIKDYWHFKEDLYEE
tara:strand:- start:6061 stop:6270 length:210 start_codon:yes stop_codon:yes gene_type:complete